MTRKQEAAAYLIGELANGSDDDIFGLEALGRDQEAVMQSYRDGGAVTSKDDEGDLHMFFSPCRVPRGLTNEEVRVCILLYPIRRFEMHAGLGDKLLVARAKDFDSLVDDFRKIREMTREVFRAGISAWLKQIQEVYKAGSFKAKISPDYLAHITDELGTQREFSAEDLILLNLVLGKSNIDILGDFFNNIS